MLNYRSQSISNVMKRTRAVKRFKCERVIVYYQVKYTVDTSFARTTKILSFLIDFMHMNQALKVSLTIVTVVSPRKR